MVVQVPVSEVAYSTISVQAVAFELRKYKNFKSLGSTKSGVVSASPTPLKTTLCIEPAHELLVEIATPLLIQVDGILVGASNSSSMS